MRDKHFIHHNIFFRCRVRAILGQESFFSENPSSVPLHCRILSTGDSPCMLSTRAWWQNCLGSISISVDAKRSGGWIAIISINITAIISTSASSASSATSVVYSIISIIHCMFIGQALPFMFFVHKYNIFDRYLTEKIPRIFGQLFTCPKQLQVIPIKIEQNLIFCNFRNP